MSMTAPVEYASPPAAMQRHGAADILGRAPAAHRDEAAGDPLVVRRPDSTGHVGIDQARPDLIHSDAGAGQPRGEELGHHAQARLGDAILAPGDAGEAAGDRRDEHDLGLGHDPGGLQLEHRAGDRLREEEGTAKVRIEHAIPALGRRFEQVEPPFGGDPGVVDPEVDPSGDRHRLVEEAASVRRIRRRRHGSAGCAASRARRLRRR